MNEKDIEAFERAQSRVFSIVDPVRASAAAWLEQNVHSSPEFGDLISGLNENDLISVKGAMGHTATYLGLIELMRHEPVKKELAQNMALQQGVRTPLFLHIRKILEWDMRTTPADFLQKIDKEIEEEYEKGEKEILEDKPPDLAESYLKLKAGWNLAKQLVLKKYREDTGLLRVIPFSLN